MPGKAMFVLLLAVVSVAPFAAPGGAQTAALQFGACAPSPDELPDAGQQCATLQLPLDYADPNGRKIEVAVSRVRAANRASRRGVLLLNPGGPGGSGLDLPRLLAALLPQSVLDRYDLIGFDPRFVGNSTPITCGLSDEEAFQAYVPLAQPGGFPATAALMRDVADACASAAGDLLPFVTTANTARDMDQIRQALGEAKISYLGYSYGTYLGAVYAALFPDQTDRIILDSSVDPDWVWRQQFRAWGSGGTLRFPDFASFAAANNGTYHFGKTPIAVQNFYLRLLHRLQSHPIHLSSGFVINGPLFQELTFSELYSDSLFPDLAEFLRLVNGSKNTDAAGTDLLQAFQALRPRAALDDGPLDNDVASGLAILCDDVAWSHSVVDYQRGFADDSRRYPLFGALGSNIWPCAFWQSQPVEPPVPITSLGPSNILMLQNRRDPATPYAGALGLRAALGPRARLVSVDQGGHTVYAATPNLCANEIGTAFLVDGSLPDDDVSCGANSSSATEQDRAADPVRQRAIRELMRRVRW
ncbi:MAG TPA: alpha/beta hydrolase [Thermoanaerobaculia bacterium]|nr:alpha/beta hydrolase [Thermoanaerobaculia bacterium]